MGGHGHGRLRTVCAGCPTAELLQWPGWGLGMQQRFVGLATGPRHPGTPVTGHDQTSELNPGCTPDPQSPLCCSTGLQGCSPGHKRLSQRCSTG
mmetsp:Transcript_25203/g.45548  ORF Transcript_25203/g.45548 Transcript_25203/m.45548 type:complete len:94 (+) Transcript_25203:1430-1711(+)